MGGRRRVAIRPGQNGQIVMQPFTEGVDATPAGFVTDLEGDPSLQQAIVQGQRRDRARALVQQEPEVVTAVGEFSRGAVSELTLGLSERALQGLLAGMDDRQAAQLLGDVYAVSAEDYAAANAGGRVAGVILPALMTGGASLEESALGRLAMLTPGGFSAGLGNLAEHAVARGLAGSVSPALARAGGLTAGAGLDGLIGGALQSITDSNIQGTPIEAQQILAGAGLGTVLGLGTGGLLSLPGLARSGSRALRTAADQSERLAAHGLGDMVDRSLRDPVVEVRIPRAQGADWLFRTISRTSGVDEDALRVMAANRDIIFDRARLNNRIQNVSAPAMEHALNNADSLLRTLQDAGERQRLIHAGVSEVPSAAFDAGASAVQTSIRQARNTLADMLEGNAVTGVARLNTETDRQLARELIRHIDTGAPTVASPADVARHADNILDFISANNLHSRATPELRSALTTVQGSLLSAANGMGPVGERLATIHTALNDLRATQRSSAGIVGREVSRGGQPTFHVDRGKLGFALTEQLGEEVRDNSVEAINDLFRSYKQALDAADVFGVPTSGAREAIDRAAEELSQDAAFSKMRTIARHAGIDESQGSGLMAALGVSGRGVGGAVAGGLAGSALGGPVGGVLGAAAGGLFSAFSHPVSTLQRLSRNSAAVASAEQRVVQSTQTLRNRLVRGGTFSKAAGRQLPRLVLALRSPKTRQREYRTMLQQVRELSSNPQTLMDRIEATTGPVSAEVHPALGDNMAITAAQGVAYLAQNIPPADLPSPFGHLMDVSPSQIEMDAFVRRFEALEDPLAIIDWAASGRLTAEHVEAVSTVYPQLFSAMQAEVSQMLSTLNRLPPYSMRMQVGTLLNTPIDDTMNAGFIHAMQQTYAQTQQQDRAQTSVSSRRAVSTRIADHTYSTSQELSLRL